MATNGTEQSRLKRLHAALETTTQSCLADILSSFSNNKALTLSTGVDVLLVLKLGKTTGLSDLSIPHSSAAQPEQQAMQWMPATNEVV